jgi:hypothetical protein
VDKDAKAFVGKTVGGTIFSDIILWCFPDIVIEI